MTLRFALTTGLLQPLYRFSSLARLTHSAEKNDDLFLFLPLLSCFKEDFFSASIFNLLPRENAFVQVTALL